MNVSVDRILAELGLLYIQNKLTQEENAKLQAQIAQQTAAQPAAESK